MGWVLAALGVAVLVLGLGSYVSRRRAGEEGLTVAIVSLIVGADLLVFALDAALV